MMDKKRRNQFAAGCAALCAVGLGASLAQAQDTYVWPGGTGNLQDPIWFNQTTNQGAQAPVAGSILQIGGGGVVNNAADFNMGGVFRLGVGGDGDTSGSFNQTAGNVTVAGTLYIGDVGAGHMTLSGTANMVVNGDTSRLGSLGNPSTLTLEGSSVLSLHRIDIGRGNIDDDASIVTIRDNATFNIAQDFVLGGWGNDNGHLEMIGGAINADRYNWGWGSKASVNITGGEVNAVSYIWAGIDPAATFEGTQSGGSVNLGSFAQFNRTSSYELSGGEFNAGAWMALGNVDGSQVTFTQSGGAVTVGDSGLWIGQGANTSGIYTISGGSLDVTTGQINIAQNGVLRVEGGEAVINAVNYGQTATGVLELVVDSLGNLSLINVADVATFAAEGTVISADLSAYTYTEGESWDVLTAASITGFEGLVLDASSDLGLRLVDGGNGQILQMYTIPEPASLVLVGAGAMLMLRRRHN